MKLYRGFRETGDVFGVLATGLIALPVLIAVLILTPATLLERKEATAALTAAVERMNAVENVEDFSALLRACESTSYREVECTLSDYPVTYKGHHMPFSYIDIRYYQKRDEGARNSPYATASVHIERRKRAELTAYDF